MSASLTVQYDQSSSKANMFGYVLKVTVTNAVDMPAEIFIFQRGAAPAPMAGAKAQDQFVCIADPVDLDEIPVLAPDIAAEIPYYRLASVTLAFRTPEDRQEVLDDIASDIERLTDSVNLMAVLDDSEVVTYPAT